MPTLLYSVPRPTPLPETPGHSQASLTQSLTGSVLPSLGSWCAQFCLGSPKMFPHSGGNAVIKCHWPPKPNPWGISASLPDAQVGKSVMGPKTFTTVWKLLWYSLSLVCGLPAPWLYFGANGDLLQEDLCHTLCLPGPVLPESLSPRLATTDLCLCRRP